MWTSGTAAAPVTTAASSSMKETLSSNLTLSETETASAAHAQEASPTSALRRLLFSLSYDKINTFIFCTKFDCVA